MDPAAWVAMSPFSSHESRCDAEYLAGAELRTGLELVKAGYVKEEKRFEGRRPQSRYRLTKAGRTALLSHVVALQALVDP
jgi:hypothetical protein